MNILFLIGNGFDINLGMKTKYADFYKYYASIKSTSSLILNLKKEIENDVENWSDLELAFGKHKKNLKSTEEFDEAFEDIEDNLADYLGGIENKFDISKIDTKKLYPYLVFPENSLPQADRNELLRFKNKWANKQWNISIITFNYTKTLENLLNYDGKHVQINSHLSDVNQPILIQRIEHIHGFIDDRMVLGVNDVSQISNNDFHNNQEVLESLVKQDCNKAQKHTIDDRCKGLVSNANLICIFGSSIGDTDKMWWENVGEQLKKDCKLIIFEKGEIISKRRPQKRLIVERKIKKLFLGKTNLNDKEKEEAMNNIFVSINSNMFKLN